MPARMIPASEDNGMPHLRSMLRILLLCCATAARAQDAADTAFTVTPLGGSVSLILVGECNIVVSASADGIVMVDTCVAEPADKLLATLRRLSDKPLQFVIDTH